MNAVSTNLPRCILYICIAIGWSLTIAIAQESQLKVQDDHLIIEVKDLTFEQVLVKLKAISGYHFLYDKQSIDSSIKLTFSFKNETLETILKHICKLTNLNYKRIDNTVTFTKKREIKDSSSPKESYMLSGRVLNRSGAPLIGATVIESERGTGVSTDIQGKFQIEVAPNSLLSITYIGYETLEISVNKRTQIDITLQDETISMDEVVVVGYGTQKKGHLTGAISTVKNEELSLVPIASVSNALSGRVSGLITTQESGLPGSDAATLSIRGFDAPLIIVDGVESSFDNIDANEIESISVLKDASAAIYGSRAGNGVVLITTKRGSKGKPTITLKSTVSLQTPTNVFKPLSAGDYTRLDRDKYLQRGENPDLAPYTEEEIQKYYAGTDPDYPSTNWFDYVMRDVAPSYQNNISISGGSEKIKYYGFFGYLKQETMIRRGDSQYERFNVRSNIDADILDNLKMTIDLASIFENTQYPNRPITTGGGLWSDLWNTLPMYPSSLPDASKIPYVAGTSAGGVHISSNRDLSGTDDKQTQTLRLQGSLNYNFKNIKGLSARAVYTYSNKGLMNKKFRKDVTSFEYIYSTDTYIEHPAATQPSLSEYIYQDQTHTGQIFLNYDREFRKTHKVTASVIYELIDQRTKDISASRDGFLTDAIPYLFAGGIDNQRAGGGATEMGRMSFIGRLNYAFRNKYLLETTFRYDGSAQFPKSSRWGFFPSISAGWVMSEEKFIKEHIKWISYLKIRGGISQTGNDKMREAFPYLSGYEIESIGYLIGDKVLPEFTSRGLPNPNLTWETMTLYNVGLDFQFLQSKLYGEVDVFYRLREGIAGTRNISIPDTFGATLPMENLNSIDTRGFEFSLGYRNHIKRAFKYDISGNVSWSRSKWVAYDESDYNDPDHNFQNKRTGKWTDRTLGFISDGLFTSQEEIDNLEYEYTGISGGNSALKPGDIKLVDRNNDGKLDWKDKAELGQGTVPHWMFGLNLSLSFKSISLTTLWQGAAGFYKNIRKVFGYNDVTFKYRWTEENNNPHAIIPRLGTNAANYWETSDYCLKRADYFRLKNLSLSYALPLKLLRNTSISKLNVFFAGTNLLTISPINKYRIDPEAPSAQVGYYYPQTRTYSFGFNISF